MGKVTIYEIAKQAGVSVSTVSRVVNNKANVNEKTRKRVLALLEKNNYSPNVAARGLVTQSSKMIGILLTDLRTTHHTEGIYYIQREMEEYGYCFLIINTGRGDEEKAQSVKILRERQVEAAILIGSTFQSEAVKEAIATYMPTIPVFLANGQIDLENCYSVVADDQHGVYRAMEYLSRRGRRCPAFLVDYHTPSNEAKERGFRDGCAHFFPHSPEPIIREAGTDVAAYAASAKELLTSHPEVDAIIASEDVIAAGVLKALNEEAISVPGRVAVMGINNSALAELVSPSLTSLDNRLLDLSITIAHNLRSVLQGKAAAKHTLVSATIREREST